MPPKTGVAPAHARFGRLDEDSISRSFCRAKSIHWPISDPDTLRGSEIGRRWRGLALVGCKRSKEFIVVIQSMRGELACKWRFDDRIGGQ